MEVNAACRESLLAAFHLVEMVVVAASTINCTNTVATAALQAGIDYFDIQIAVKAKHEVLESLRKRIVQSGRCFITDGGYRPGIPAAMVRYAACQLPGLESAPVASTFQVNWKERQFASSSAAEFADELQSFSLLVFEEGQYYVLVPLSFGLLALFPKHARNWIARLMEWGLKHTTRPPYGAVLRMDAQGIGQAIVMTVSSHDAYFLTAAPAVACLLQLFDGTIRKPGLWRQGTLVEPVRFFTDLASLGVSVTSPSA